MPWMDPGTNTFGGGWGGGFGGGGGSYQPPRTKPNIPSVGGGFGGYGVMPSFGLGSQASRYGQDANAMQQWGKGYEDQRAQDSQLFGQGINERNMALQQKYQMQQLQAQLSAQQQMAWMNMYSQGMALPTGDQIERSRGDLGQSLQDYAKQRDQGRYSQGEMDTLSGDMYNKINQGAMASAQNFGQQQAARGSYASPGATAALRMAGNFNANAARGGVQADLLRENKDAMDVGRQGYANISSQLADYASRPINRMANFNWGDMFGGGEDPEKKKKPMAYGNGQPWTPQVGGTY